MMNTVRKSENLLPFPVISAAANGDTNAMCAILKHYGGYIAKLCTRTLKDDAGNTYSYVDEEMRNKSLMFLTRAKTDLMAVPQYFLLPGASRRSIASRSTSNNTLPWNTTRSPASCHAHPHTLRPAT